MTNTCFLGRCFPGLLIALSILSGNALFADSVTLSNYRVLYTQTPYASPADKPVGINDGGAYAITYGRYGALGAVVYPGSEPMLIDPFNAAYALTPIAINNSGLIAANSYTPNNGGLRGITYDGTNVRIFPQPEPASFISMDNAGNILGAFERNGAVTNAFITNFATNQQSMFSLPGSTNTLLSLNDNGQVLGSYGSGQYFIRNADGSFENFSSTSALRQINNAGLIVGTNRQNGVVRYQGIEYTFASPDGTRTEFWALNNTGSIIGLANRASQNTTLGLYTGFLVSANTSLVPEPAGLFVFGAIAMTGFAVTRRRRIRGFRPASTQESVR